MSKNLTLPQILLSFTILGFASIISTMHFSQSTSATFWQPKKNTVMALLFHNLDKQYTKVHEIMPLMTEHLLFIIKNRIL